MAKLIHTNGKFDVYKAGAVLAIYENGEFAFNLRKSDRGFFNIEGHIASILRVEAEIAAEKALIRAERRELAAARLAAFIDRKAAQPAFAF